MRTRSNATMVRSSVLLASLLVAQLLSMAAAPLAAATEPAPTLRPVPPIASPARAPEAAPSQRSFASPSLPAGADPEPGRSSPPPLPSPVAAAAAKPGRSTPPGKPSGAPAARRAGEEVVERRTERSKTFATADPDRFKTQLFGGPVHFKSPRSGKWVDIAAKLVDAAPGRLRNEGGLVNVDLAKDQGVGPLARIEVDDGHSVAFSLQGAERSRGRVQANRVSYPDVRPHVDLELAVVASGLKEDIVLDSPAAPDRFVFELDLEGLSARLNDGGDVVYVDATGAQRAVTPHGYMTDATWRPGSRAGARSEAVRYELSSRSGKTLLTVAADRSWLSDPDRVYPVRIDPTFFQSTGREDDTYIWFGGGYPPGDRAYEWELNVGSLDGANYARAYMNFELYQLNNKAIDSATFHIFQKWSNSCVSRGYSLYRVTQGWEGHSMTGPPGASTGDWVGNVSMGCDSNWRSWNVTDTVRNWTSGAWGQYGLMLKADLEPVGDTLRQFKSWNTSGCACDIPHIDIYWTNPPSMATPIAPANGANFHTLTPTLAVSASDPDGDAVQYYYRVARYAGPGNGDDAETNVVYNSGWTTASSLTLPPGVLAWNATYTWHVYTYDGVAVTGPNWVWWFAPVNNAPGVASPSSPANGATFHTLTPTLAASASDPDGDAVQYYYRVSRYVSPGNGDDAETNVVYNSGWTSASSLAVPAGVLAWNATYTWHVYTYDGIAQTNPNWVWWFSPTNAAPTTPILTAPPDGASVGVTNPTLSASASDPDGDAVSVAFKVSTSPNLTGSLVQSGFGPASWNPPAGALHDGQTYYWSAITRDAIGAVSGWAATRSFRVDLRLGMRPSVPYDTMGPVSVNLANGNVVAGLSSPPVAAVGGPLGVSYAYNSYGKPSVGLSGSYFNDDGNGVFDEAASLTRTDATVDFDWGTASPHPVIGPDNFLVRWTGYLTAPAGIYSFGTAGDDGVRVWVDNTLVVNRWLDPPSATPVYGSPVNLTGATVPIRVEHHEAAGAASVSLWQSGPGGASPLPAAWLSTEAPALPDGWSLSADAGGDLAYTEARFGTAEVVLVDATGATSRYTWTGTAWKPPDGEDAVVTNDAGRGLLVVQAEDGRAYAFGDDGRLESVTSALDPRQPAAPVYTWSGSPLRLAAITDPVSGRSVTLSYGGRSTCPSAAGFGPVPAHMLCKVDLSAFGAGAQELYYLNNHLARVVEPGGAMVDFGYDGAGRLTQVRDSLTNDLIAAGHIPDPTSATHMTTVAYDTLGRATGVTAPEPAAGAARLAHTYDYASALTKVHVAGVPEPNGYARRVTLDAVGRLATDANAAAETTSYTWDDGDRLTRRADPAGRVTTTAYDAAGRPTDTYGPGLAGEFAADNRSATAPHATTAYDESMAGLASTYWSNKSLAGAPVGFDLGVGHPTGALSADWGGGAPASIPAANGGDGWSARFSGEIILPQAGTYSFRASSNDGVRLFIDDARVLEAWSDHSGLSPTATFANARAESRHRIRVEYYDNTGAASLELQWAPPGSGTFSVVPGANLSPRYGLATSSVDPDGHKVATEYANAHLGLPTATVVDPAGLALRSTTTYEGAGTGYYRRSARRLPKGAASEVTYAYFGATEGADNPCTAGVEATNQAGALKSETAADPDGAGPQAAIVRQYRYDGAGRRVAARVVGDAAWTCTAYDARGRVTSRTDTSGKTTTIDYAVPAVATSRVADSAGTARATIDKADWMGRSSSYTDELGTTTRRVYDLGGRVASTYRGGRLSASGAAGAEGSCRVAGPDAGGYTCEPVAYDWVDTATGATPVPLGDDATSSPIGLPFAFSWYGQSKASVSIGSNGLVCFTPTGCDSSVPTTPATGAPNDMVACFWEDLDPSAAGTVRYKTVGTTPNRIFVVEFNAVPHYGYTETNTFQFQLAETGQARCMFSSVATQGVIGTVVGTENATGTTGLVYKSGTVEETSTGVRFGPGGAPSPADSLLTEVSYDTAGRVGSLTEWASLSPFAETTFSYDASGLLTNVVRPANAARTSTTYDAARGWATTISHQYLGVSLARFDYTRRPSGSVATEATAGRTRAFTYDGAGRLVTTAESTPLGTTTRAYAYDANTNRCATAAACDGTWTYDNADRLIVSPQASAYTYDSHGNLTSAALRDTGVLANRSESIAYDANDHAVEINDGTSKITETLSPSGRVLRRVVRDNVLGALLEDTVFGYDGPGDSPAYAIAVDGEITTYIQGPSGLLLTTRAGVPSYPLTNAHGDIVARTDVAGVFLPVPVADEFGRGDSPPDRLGWLGSHQRYSTGGDLKLVRMGVRLYDPALGRFLQVDPVEGGSANDYDYVMGDPVNGLDLDGLCKTHHKGLWGHVRSARCRTSHGAGYARDGAAQAGRAIGRGTAATGRAIAGSARATVTFTRQHIGDIGTGVGCGLGIAGAETGVGLALAAATCGTAIGLGVAGHRTGNASYGRVGVGYGCAVGFLTANNPVSFLAATAGCVNGAGFQAADELEGG